MRVEVKMPILNQGMQSGRIIRWLVAVGDSVQRGEAVAAIETDKAITEMEATVSGTVAEVMHDEGDDVAVGMPIAYIETEN